MVIENKHSNCVYKTYRSAIRQLVTVATVCSFIVGYLLLFCARLALKQEQFRYYVNYILYLISKCRVFTYYDVISLQIFVTLNYMNMIYFLDLRLFYSV